MTCRCQAEHTCWPAKFWRWSCLCGAGGAADLSSTADEQAAEHMLTCGQRPVRMHTGASPKPWAGQVRL